MTRLLCVVPFCRRSHENTEGFDEWICGKHWPLIPKARRRVYGRLVRQWRRWHRQSDGLRAGRVWNVLRRTVIERSAGL